MFFNLPLLHLRVLLEQVVDAVALGQEGSATALALKWLPLAAIVSAQVDLQRPVGLQVLTTEPASCLSSGASRVRVLGGGCCSSNRSKVWCGGGGDVLDVFLDILPRGLGVLLPEVALAVGLDSERIMADPADIGPLAAVCPKVSDQRGFVWSHVVADVTLVGKDAEVEAHVSLQDAGEGKHLVAESALERARSRAGVGIVSPFGSWLSPTESRLLVYGCGGSWWRIRQRRVSITHTLCVQLPSVPS